ncbi:hypothetical protein PSCICO_45330 [Pseudomonas cichorii]|nr:hypothetical protein PSCICO_45330 [Pseudomonas cichorii]
MHELIFQPVRPFDHRQGITCLNDRPQAPVMEAQSRSVLFKGADSDADGAFTNAYLFILLATLL